MYRLIYKLQSILQAPGTLLELTCLELIYLQIVLPKMIRNCVGVNVSWIIKVKYLHKRFIFPMPQRSCLRLRITQIFFIESSQIHPIKSFLLHYSNNLYSFKDSKQIYIFLYKNQTFEILQIGLDFQNFLKRNKLAYLKQ